MNKLDQRTINAAIRTDRWAAETNAIVDTVVAASDNNDMSTEQCIALGIILERKRVADAISSSAGTALSDEALAGLVKRLDEIAEHDWRFSFLAHTSDTAKEAADTIRALELKAAREAEPVADWRVEREDQDDGSISYHIFQHKPDYRWVLTLNDIDERAGQHAKSDAYAIVKAVAASPPSSTTAELVEAELGTPVAYCSKKMLQNIKEHPKLYHYLAVNADADRGGTVSLYALNLKGEQDAG